MKFSSDDQKGEFKEIIDAYWRIPEIFRGPHMPGGFAERAIAKIRNGKTVKGYTFVDVLSDNDSVGFQVKTTKDSTVVTWMRANIPDRDLMVLKSKKQLDGNSETQALGNAIIDFANKKIEASFEDNPNLDQIIYARFRSIGKETVIYTEAPLIERGQDPVFDKDDYEWAWANTSLIGRKDGVAWWSWYPGNDNQLHFTGEKIWLNQLFESRNLKRIDYEFVHNQTFAPLELNRFKNMILED